MSYRLSSPKSINNLPIKEIPILSTDGNYLQCSLMLNASIIFIISALSGILFPGMEEAAYSNFRLWEATGSVVAYAYSPYLCTSTKLYVLLVILMAGVIGYAIIEMTGTIKKIILIDPTTDFELVGNNELTTKEL